MSAPLYLRIIMANVGLLVMLGGMWMIKLAITGNP